MTLGFDEFFGLLAAFVGVGWALLKVTLSQFEKRLDSRFQALDDTIHDVKRLELEQIRMDGKFAITYATKEELMRVQERHEKTLERVFDLIRSLDEKMDSFIRLCKGHNVNGQ